MKKTTQLLFALFCLCLPMLVQAQKRDDTKYLAGAVPEINGKVVFSKEFSIPGMSKNEIFERMQKWMQIRLKRNQNETSRVVYADKEKGQVVGIGEEWIVFSSTALALDRTRVQYQIGAFCHPETCELRIEKIRYTYGEGREQEKYTAEEWITDEYALNKSQTKLVRGLAKWRRKTVDFADALCTEAAEALSAASIEQIVALNDEETEEEKNEQFTKALTAALRSDPDVILVGETRSLSTAELTFKGALSGHGVWTTLHANSAPAIVTRLRDMGIQPYLLNDPELVKGLVSQRLFRKLCTNCRQSIKTKEGSPEFDRLRNALGDYGIENVYVSGPGCKACGYKGFKGRMAVDEIILPDSRFLRLMIDNETAKAILDGILAFITPVIISVEGLCVATIKCIPAARAI